LIICYKIQAIINLLFNWIKATKKDGKVRKIYSLRLYWSYLGGFENLERRLIDKPRYDFKIR
jgi:hypothetical protein